MPDILEEDAQSAEIIFEVPGESPVEVPAWFDEKAYLEANPDVAASLGTGLFKSGYQHFRTYGQKEKRPLRLASAVPLDQVVRTHHGQRQSGASAEVRAAVDAVLISPSGGVAIIGWVDDVGSPAEWVQISGTDWRLRLSRSRLGRVRRQDVEVAIGAYCLHLFGFLGFLYAAEKFESGDKCQVTIRIASGAEITLETSLRRVGDIELRNVVLGYIANAELFGNRQVEAVKMLRGSLGAEIIKHNCDISKSIVRGGYVERFGPQNRRPIASMIVCLYGKPEYMFLQSALFGGNAGFDEFEMIYVSNSPELAEQLLKDIRTAALIYDLPQTLVLLPGNAGFGAANNVAVNYARSDRIVVVNPDVFPHDRDWARKHTDAITNLPDEQTKLFGVPLYYDDGSLMHGGMYFEYDTGISVGGASMTAQRVIRVEHYGKGTPAETNLYSRARPVPAISGAFISAKREWYELLGGFTEDFVFGHYEDADLCLKSLLQGAPAWIQDIRLWHLEGKGSTRLPVHEGGSCVNRALFSDKWASLIADGLEGPRPTHPLLNPEHKDTLPEAKKESNLHPVGPSKSLVVSQAEKPGKRTRR